jgi:hypothetical protein
VANLAKLRQDLADLITTDNLSKWGLDGHRRIPRLRYIEDVIKECFPFTIHPDLPPFDWSQKRRPEPSC